MPDWPIAALGGKSPLERASTPQMDRLASLGRLGLVRTIPPGMPPGSDVGHLAILGYNPRRYYTGRAPIEAAAMGIRLGRRDVAFRCNLVTLSRRAGVTVMQDFSAGHIRSTDSHRLIRRLQKRLGGNGIEFYPGVSYRHIMVWRRGPVRLKLTPPHDITGRPIESHLPKGEMADRLIRLMSDSQRVLKGNRANSIWLWGHGKATRLSRFPKKGAILSAVDIVRGVGRLAGLEVIRVPGATGYFDTDYENKARYALRALRKFPFVFVHLEATDEAGHMGDLKRKLKALEDFDRRLIGPLWKGLEKQFRPYRILLTSDHATPLRLKTHTRDPVVFAIYDSRFPSPLVGEGRVRGSRRFNEKAAKRTGDVVGVGYRLMKEFLKS